MSEQISIAELPAFTSWVLKELGMVSVDRTVSREHVRTLGEFVLRFAGTPAMPASGVAAVVASTSIPVYSSESVWH